MIKIAIIEKNKCYFDKMQMVVPDLLYNNKSEIERQIIKNNINDYIWSVMEPFVNFMEIDKGDLIEKSCELLTLNFPDKKPDEHFFYHTESSYSFPKRHIELIYCQPLWGDYISDETTINNLACLLSVKQSVLENTCIAFADEYDINEHTNLSICSIDKIDLIKIIRRRYFFSAILIKNENFIKYYYQNPAYLIMQIFGKTENDTVQKLSINNLKYNLTLYFIHDKTNYVNKIATRINGLYRLYGDVLVIHETEDNVFQNISFRELKRLNVLSYGRLYDREIKNTEIHTEIGMEPNENGEVVEKPKTPYWSKYIIVNNRIKIWQKNKKCINCDVDLIGFIICDKCYRVKYCSEKCKKEFESYHNDECINIKSY